MICLIIILSVYGYNVNIILCNATW